jgi:hypothetical protein
MVASEPFKWSRVPLILLITTVCFPMLWSWRMEDMFFRRVHLQRGLAIVGVGLIQLQRVVVAALAWEYAWPWLAWLVCITLTWRVLKTAMIWWEVIENPRWQYPSPEQSSPGHQELRHT